MFVTPKYIRDTKPNDAMYAWLENVDNRGFEVCVREFLPFDGKHQDAVVVSKRIEPFLHPVILPDLADFALQEQREDNLMVPISWAWYNKGITTF